MVKQVILTIANRCGLPMLSATTTCLGTQYDHEAQELALDRPEEWSEHDAILFFADGAGGKWRVNLGQDNTYLVPNTLTQTTQLLVQVAFQRGEDYRAGANQLSFTLRPSMQNGATPEPIPDIVSTLEREAVTSGYVDERTSESVYTNMQGNERFRLPAGGSAVNVQSDYDENDSAADSYIQNRPFYEISETIEIFPMSSIVSDSSGMARITISTPLILGEEYVIKFAPPNSMLAKEYVIKARPSQRRGRIRKYFHISGAAQAAPLMLFLGYRLLPAV